MAEKRYSLPVGIFSSGGGGLRFRLRSWQVNAGAEPRSATILFIPLSTPTTKKLMMLHGTVSDDGKTFTDDKDQKAWTVQNPEALKGHEGHHVSVKAHVHADKGEIHVVSVKMWKASKG